MPTLGPYKVHWFVNGFIALLVGISLGLMIRKWLWYATAFIVFLFFNYLFSIGYDWKETINTLVGPLLFYYVTMLIDNNLLITKGIMKTVYIYIVLALVPLGIAVLQYIGLAPLTILAFDYINMTKIDGEFVPRVNGFLYHPSELANIGYLLFAMLTVLTKNKFFVHPYFVIFFILQLMILIKSSIAGLMLLFFYFLYCQLGFSKKLQNALIVVGLVCFAGLVILLFREMGALISEKILSPRRNMIFEPGILTNRGRMWSIYAYAIRDLYEIKHCLFGSGFGSNQTLFLHGDKTLGIWPQDDYIPHPHNQFLSIFINGGLALMGVYGFILSKSYFSLRRFTKTAYSLTPILIIFLLSSGMTVLVLDRFSIWVMLSFLLIIFYVQQKNLQEKINLANKGD